MELRVTQHQLELASPDLTGLGEGLLPRWSDPCETIDLVVDQFSQRVNQHQGVIHKEICWFYSQLL